MTTIQKIQENPVVATAGAAAVGATAGGLTGYLLRPKEDAFISSGKKIVGEATGLGKGVLEGTDDAGKAFFAKLGIENATDDQLKVYKGAFQKESVDNAIKAFAGEGADAGRGMNNLIDALYTAAGKDGKVKLTETLADGMANKIAGLSEEARKGLKLGEALKDVDLSKADAVKAAIKDDSTVKTVANALYNTAADNAKTTVKETFEKAAKWGAAKKWGAIAAGAAAVLMAGVALFGKKGGEAAEANSVNAQA